VSGSYRKDLARLARELGWSIEKTRGDHVRLTHPNALGFVIAPWSPRSCSVLHKVRADLRRAMRKGE
jgi:predicted RNA binding protein YcfA (HicA-like mRNA interferase family)